ncbi:zinc transporter ZIP13 isoform X1 [Chiloscyllium plagiosum]|uniref:zinc transporter ZIP13 isoform X1 n=1 Tax=Chiloscyllium plagiosum TaxID=36176 RepID=UPI001CB87281|nr:zinc transporter ZIP13 isoform X1 [Chiloscyllium plagiosum]
MVGQKQLWSLLVVFCTCSMFLPLASADIHRANAKKLARKAAAAQAAIGSNRWCPENVFEFRSWSELFTGERVDAWICSLIGSVMVGLSGIFPLLVIPVEAGASLKSKDGSQRLKRLLSFAIGGLLGDVFLHLLPEAWAYTCNSNPDGSHSRKQQRKLGLWVIVGLLAFFILEKLFPDKDEDKEYQKNMEPPVHHKLNCPEQFYNEPFETKNGHVCLDKAIKHLKNGKLIPSASTRRNGSCVQLSNGHCRNSTLQLKVSPQPVQVIKISGYLNLIANGIDNFTHGLAVAGSFLVSRKVGLTTTLAILLHEVPHEVGDFAILLRAGFDRWSAAKMQLTTAFGGVLGACFAMCAESPEGAGDSVAWILPFTSGGFLYIALVSVVPDLLQEKDVWNSVCQVLLLCCGIGVMMLVSAIV